MCRELSKNEEATWLEGGQRWDHRGSEAFTLSKMMSESFEREYCCLACG
jgi:hypothetical protein